MASVVLPLPLSPATVRIVGSSSSSVSETSFSAMVDVRAEQAARVDLGDVVELEQVSHATALRSLSYRDGRRPCGRPASVDRLRAYGRCRSLHDACGQRGWKAQPLGRRSSEGARPGMPWNTPLFVEARQAADQRLGVGVLGIGEHLAHRADLDQPAGVHHRHLVDELRHQAHVVADQDDRRADLRPGPCRSSPSPGAASPRRARWSARRR